MQKNGITQKLIRVFVIQMLFISVVTAAGVFVAAIIVEQVMIRTALEDEAAHFWQEHDKNHLHPSPNTDNLRGYLAVGNQFDNVPIQLHKITDGFQHVDMNGHQPIVYVEQHQNKRLYLVFDEGNVRSLSFYFGVVPLSMALILIYLSAWFAYRSSRKTLSPLMSLAKTMGSFDLSKHQLETLHLDDYTNHSVDDEVSVLAESLKEFTRRLRQQLQREREFTHDVSHELRTPLAVIRGSLDLLGKPNADTQQQQRAIRRMRATSEDMLAIIETLLLLARDSESADTPRSDVYINELIPSLIEQVERTHNADRHVDISVQDNSLLTVTAPKQAINIIVSNLLRNACNYTHQGVVIISVDGNKISISDSGEGIAAEEIERIKQPFERSSTHAGGYGLGLDIVRRLCAHFGWRLAINSEIHQGTVVTVYFNNSQATTANNS